MQKNMLACAKALGILLFAIAPAQAITYGELDGNGHPNVGAMMVDAGRGLRAICSGTLISPKIFLTAAHCIEAAESRGITQAFVSFDSELTEVSTVFPGKMRMNPGYNKSQSDTGDIAVIELDQPVTGITPAQLPTVGFFDQEAAKNGLKDKKFTAVGYGLLERQVGGGQPSFGRSNLRMVSTSSFSAINPTVLRMSQNPATGDGGACFGDSGGPNFLSTTNVIAAITVSGDSVCRATNVTYRLDTESARNFLKDYVELP